MAKRDRALATARDILHKAVCECGCLETEHGVGPARRCYGKGCACTRFKAVRFYVVRYRDRYAGPS
jgi:hypothetical protein